jgi:hypothetical protein
VIRLGIETRAIGFNLRHDRRSKDARLIELGDVGLRDLRLFDGRRKDRRSILRSNEKQPPANTATSEVACEAASAGRGGMTTAFSCARERAVRVAIAIRASIDAAAMTTDRDGRRCTGRSARNMGRSRIF